MEEQIVTMNNGKKIDNSLQTLASVAETAKVAVDLGKAIVEAQKEIYIVDQEVNKFLANLESQHYDREAKLQQVQMLHQKMDRLIDTANELVSQGDVSDAKMQLVTMYLTLAHDVLGKLPNL